VPSNVSVNGHIYYIVLKSPKVLKELMNYGNKKGISFQEHYQCLHLSPYNKKYGSKVKLKNSEKFAKNILRLPIYPDLKVKDLKRVVNTIEYFCKKI
jgi:dTDP-4-amino-4,6-dideoxygalactose transaminase